MRLVLVLPKRRLWRWHLALIDQLRARGAEVAVLLDETAAPHRPDMLAWLGLERRRLGPRALAEPASADPAWPTAGPEAAADALLVNLAESPLASRRGLELRYDGALEFNGLLAALLRRGSPTLEVGYAEPGPVLARSRPAIEDRAYLAPALEFCFSRATSLLLRAVDRLGEAAPPASPAAAPDGREGVSAGAADGALALPAFAARSLFLKGRDTLLRPLRHPDHWTTALRLGPGPFRPIEDDGERYYADPFLCDWDDRRLLFVEEFDHASGRGHISAAEIHGDGLVAPPVPVLTRPYHLSYPLVFSEGGERYMIPESGANRSVELYRAAPGPWSWEFVAPLLEGRAYADATPLHHGGRWWLFVAADDHGAATQDELQLWSSERLGGPYRPHPMNPIVSDCRFARPAGRIRKAGGRLLRPAQDCEAGYGAGIAWFAIRELTPTTYREELLTVWRGDRDFGTSGLHSFDQLGDLQAIDLNGPRWRGRLRGTPRALRPGEAFDTAFLNGAGEGGRAPPG